MNESLVNSQFFYGFHNLRNQNEEPASNLNVANETHKECEGSTKLWVGKDYTNFIVKDSDHLDEPLTG